MTAHILPSKLSSPLIKELKQWERYFDGRSNSWEKLFSIDTLTLPASYREIIRLTSINMIKIKLCSWSYINIVVVENHMLSSRSKNTNTSNLLIISILPLNSLQLSQKVRLNIPWSYQYSDQGGSKPFSKSCRLLD